MKIYLAVPLAYNRDRMLATALAGSLEESGHVVTSRWVLDEDPSWGLTYGEIAKRDFGAVDESDALVAEISTPSHGVGMEIQYAVMKGKKVICLRRPDSRVSGLISGTPAISLVAYVDRDDAARRVSRLLSEE
ncbi:MAG TPA: nucleoside 2-deoxyribosyltransferase [Conexivisphaerales archaeon]|nr:nucleoside 2-deoxyribosyltransferase [Conexivisphaerales archaeon]